MSSDFGFTDYECKIINNQIARRAKYRKEFLKLKSDPYKHSKESGYVFDEALQRFLSMKASQLEYFQVTPKTISFAVGAIIIPMVSYGYLVWTHRQKFLKDVRCGKIKYKDRIHKFK